MDYPSFPFDEKSGDEETPRQGRRTGVLEEIARKFEQSIKVNKALFQIANLTSSADEMQIFYGQVHDVVKSLTSAENLFLALLNEGQNGVSIPYFSDRGVTEHPHKFMELDFVKKQTVTGMVLETRQMVHLDSDSMQKLRVEHGILPSVGELPQDWLGVPLLLGEHLLGALVIQSHEPGFRYSQLDESLLTQIGQQVAIAIERKRFARSLKAAHDQLQVKNVELEKSAQFVTRTNAKLKRLLKERTNIHHQLKHSATHDSLTGLPNRRLFLSELKRVIDASRGDSDLEYAVLFMDLDRFKVVNDSLGHLIGDALLKETANRLRKCIRPLDMVARLGGDEFCVLLSRDATDEVIYLVANRILATLKEPTHLDGHRVVTSASIGITRGRDGYECAEDMLRDADTALYRAKADGKSRYQIFDRSLREQAILRHDMEQALRMAIDENDISVFYQPIVDIRTGQIVSFEALARWTHPEFGMVPAHQFISIAEEIHLMPQLTAAVLRKSAHQICQWRKEIGGLQNLGLNINISSRQIENGDSVEIIRKNLERVDLPPECLKLEVTESLLLNNLEFATGILNEFHEMKVKLALDDFGTGYSSLACLNSLPLDELKIDLSFVRNIVTEPRSFAIVQMIVALAEVMNLKVVAEGVENQAQLQILRELNVDYAQGFLFGQPASATSVTMALAQISNRSPDVFVFDNPFPASPQNIVDLP